MSWISELVKVYDENQARVGKTELVSVGKEKSKEVILMPISHTSVNIPIQINIDKDGNFLSAVSIPKEEQRTIIPTTLKSASRSSGIAPMPVDDKLKYVAADYHLWSKKDKDQEYHQEYLEQFKDFIDYIDENYTGKVKNELDAIYKYIANNSLLADLCNFKIFGDIRNVTDIPKRWSSKENKPQIYEVATGSPMDSFIRFHVRGLSAKPRYLDPDMFDAWIKYYTSTIDTNKGVDYVSGDTKVDLTDSHPKGILPSASNAKLISANDKTNYTFKGRFLTSDEAATVGYVNSQKAHLALRWLIDRQGFAIGGRYYLAWGRDNQNYMKPIQQNDMGFLAEIINKKLSTQRTPNTNEQLAINLKETILNYKNTIGKQLSDLVYIIELDTSTPGRAEVVYYQALDLTQYINKLTSWYENIALQTVRYGKQENHSFSLRTIANMVNGSKAKDELKKNTISALISVIFSSRVVPRNIIMALYNKAIRPLSFDPNDPNAKYLGWQPTLEVTSKLFRTWYKDEGVGEVLNDNLNDRSYLYGRLLAIADVIEGGVLKDNIINRPTNAQRYMSAFAQRPADTWRTIYINSQPYMAKSKYAKKAQQLIDHVFNKLTLDNENIDHLNDQLDGKFLIGYSQQRTAWFESYKKENSKSLKEN